jgi:hypothetical protein
MKRVRGVLSGLAVAVLSAPLPALAYARDAGDEPGAGMSVLETVGFFVVLPLAIWGVIWLLWSLPKWMRESRPVGEAWNPVPSRDAR